MTSMHQKTCTCMDVELFIKLTMSMNIIMWQYNQHTKKDSRDDSSNILEVGITTSVVNHAIGR